MFRLLIPLWYRGVAIMKYRTSVLRIDPKFPFAIYHGSGYTVQQYDNGQSWMHRHHSLEINYVLRGSGRYEIGDQIYPVERGDLFVINNLEYHQAVNESSDLLLMVLVFDSELVLSGGEDYALVRAFYEWKKDFKHRIPASSAIVTDIVPLLLELETEWTQKQVGYCMVIRALLLKLLAVLYRGFEQTNGYAQSIRRFQSGYVRLAPAIALMESSFREPLTLEEIAQTVHMNRNYFSTLFTQLMGCTVSDYLMRRRLKNAVLLLMSTDQSVISVAMDSGFRNVSYFNRTFHKHYGLPPGQYREHMRTEQESTFQ